MSKIKTLAEFDLNYIDARSYIVGVDEAGRGALAGPVSAGAVAISTRLYKDEKFLETLALLNDSKQLDHKKRKALYDKLYALQKTSDIRIAQAFASVEEIEQINILSATSLAMNRTLKNLNEALCLNLSSASKPQTLFGESSFDVSLAIVLLDGKPMKKLNYAHTAIVKGDTKSLAISAGSIIAKVSRDIYMQEQSLSYPDYSFEVHKGYATALHRQKLLLFGAADIHRQSFLKNIRGESVKETQADFGL